MKSLRRKDLVEAYEQLGDLIAKGASEPELQKLFASKPYILSQGLPLALHPADIVPLGRPGKEEADFVFFPHDDRVPFLYGTIELKRPDTPLLDMPRKDLLILSKDATTALKQAEKFSKRLKRDLSSKQERIAVIGNTEYLFLLAGMSGELRKKVTNEELRDQFGRLLPPNCQLLPFDTLQEMFGRSIPKAVYLVRPEGSPGNSVLLQQLGVHQRFLREGSQYFDEARFRAAGNCFVVFWADILVPRPNLPLLKIQENLHRAIEANARSRFYFSSSVVNGIVGMTYFPKLSLPGSSLSSEDLNGIIGTIAQMLGGEPVGWNPRNVQIDTKDGSILYVGLSFSAFDGAHLSELVLKAARQAREGQRAIIVEGEIDKRVVLDMKRKGVSPPDVSGS